MEASSIPARSEKVILARCKKHCSMLTADFEPKTSTEIPCIFATRVIPNINGEFQKPILNVTEAEVMITAGKVLGHIRQAGEMVYKSVKFHTGIIVILQERIYGQVKNR